MNNLSAFIITQNEEDSIRAAILSIRDIAEEVIVVDSGSTDKTIEIARELGAKVYFSKCPEYVRQKIFAEGLCKNNWLLNIDANEELSQELQDEIDHIFQTSNKDSYYAYAINFVTMLGNATKPKYLAPSNKYIRLYNKNFASFSNILPANDCSSADFNNEINSRKKLYDLNGVAYHRPSLSIDQLMKKANFFSNQKTSNVGKDISRVSNLRIAFALPLRFLKIYFKRRYFVFGFDGFVYATTLAFTYFVSLSRARKAYLKKQK